MRVDYLEFMGKIIERGHASQIPCVEAPPPPGRSWYLPHFATYNTKHTIQVVFNSGSEFEGVSLMKNGEEAKRFIHRNFYVDDGLASLTLNKQ